MSAFRLRASLLAGVAGLALVGLTACEPAPSSDNSSATSQSEMNENAPQSALIDRALAFTPPSVEARPVTIEQLGRTRTDNYAWLRDENWQQVMRDPSVLKPEIRAFLEAENAYYEEVMSPLSELQETIYQEMRGRIREDDSSVPSRDGEWFYYSRYREGGQYPVFARRPADENGEISGEEQVILDGDAEAEGVEYFSLGALEHSPDQRYVAWAVDTNGSEYYEIRIRDLETGEDIATLTDEGYGSLEWANDSRTIYWVWRDENARPKRVYRQAIDSTERELVYEETDDGYFIGVSRTDGNSWISIYTGDHTTSEIRLYDANDPAAEALLVSEREEGVEYSLTETGNGMFIRTNQDGAVDFQIMRAPVDNPRRENWEPFIEHRSGTYVNGLMGFENWLVRSERENALPRIVVRNVESGEEFAIAFEEEAFSLGMSGGYEFATDEMRFTYESPSTPRQTWDFNMATRERTLRKEQEIPSGHNPEDYTVRRINITARDGTPVPVTILHRADTPIDGSAPLLLYGYGSYGYSMPASFSISNLSLVDRGMVYAIAHIRGGTDNGYQWYLDGKLDRKMNTFNDFVDAGRALAAEGYTSEGNIVAFGGSAGGLLVGAAMNQAPELFSGVIGAVPFVDVINTISDPTLPLTPPEWNEWGNPITDEAAYDYMLSYSPYDQVSAQDYPHLLATAGLTDPRVTYWEPAKWVARVREMRTDNGLTLLRTNMGAGHGGASGRFDSLRERAQDWAFALMVSGLADSEASVDTQDAPAEDAAE
ncbi:peptidase S9 [Glycocaulis albus]|uniref:Peptidase S9 n=1 Tax=Glycocaulis albus TaxID=1382801 RepID=A0ABQ1XXS9_9PROT|nr:S9 family peptidase [Glycocaulis albus]MBV5257501.1 S9 family peptidase [Synechococcus moorigangaii CMS01]GGH06365.1 peptidase S9 [Glycocaulis albus]